MASSYSYTVLSVIFCSVIICLCKQTNGDDLFANASYSIYFPLTQRLSRSSRSLPLNSKLSFKYSRALIVSLPVGTPPQFQDMVLDTGSQLSWIKCRNIRKPSAITASFTPSLSSSFSIISCESKACKPQIPDFTLPTTCDEKRFCHYSYFYADGTFAEGNLVKEKISLDLRNSISTPPLVLGCGKAGADNEGILGMNLGRLSFVSQAKVSSFSYCVPPRHGRFRGSFYLGPNPNSRNFLYVNTLNYRHSRLPNLDPLAYTVPLTAISINGKRLNIPSSFFRPNFGGAGQTMVDSGTEYTFLVAEAYSKVKEAVLSAAGHKWKKGFVYQGVLDLCFEGDAMEIGRLIGDLVFEFEKGVKIVIDKRMTLDDVGGGVHCFGIGGSDPFGLPSNIIGNFHQQNLWVEFDVANRRVGFGRADCSK